jgi:hypothetical protein
MLAPVSAALERPRLSVVSARSTIHAKLRGPGSVESADGQFSTPNGRPALRYIVALHQITMVISTTEVQLKMLMEIIVFRNKPFKPLDALGRFLSIASGVCEEISTRGNGAEKRNAALQRCRSPGHRTGQEC